MRLQKLLIAFVLCLCLSVIVFAHPGGTDSTGGHTDHSTGEYHYHHGYSAHQHYDMDRDGNLDCPYLFDDKTDSSGNKTESSKDETKPPVIKLAPKKETSKERTTLDYVRIGGCLFIAFGILVDLLKWAFDEIKKKHRK